MHPFDEGEVPGDVEGVGMLALGFEDDEVQAAVTPRGGPPADPAGLIAAEGLVGDDPKHVAMGRGGGGPQGVPLQAGGELDMGRSGPLAAEEGMQQVHLRGPTELDLPEQSLYLDIEGGSLGFLRNTRVVFKISGAYSESSTSPTYTIREKTEEIHIFRNSRSLFSAAGHLPEKTQPWRSEGSLPPLIRHPQVPIRGGQHELRVPGSPRREAGREHG
jgi:hypothetical protein